MTNVLDFRQHVYFLPEYHVYGWTILEFCISILPAHLNVKDQLWHSQNPLTKIRNMALLNKFSSLGRCPRFGRAPH